MPGSQSTHFNLVGTGTETFTGSITVAITNLRQLEKVIPVQVKSTAPNECAKLTVQVSADKKTFTLFAWKFTASGDNTLIAATAAVTVDYIAFGQ